MGTPYTVGRCCYSNHALADLPASGIVDVPLAQTGEGIAECELLKWFVKEVSEGWQLSHVIKLKLNL